VAPNLYGYGQSSPWPPAPHRPPTMADLTAIVGAAAGASPPPTHLVGHSMGAGVALAAVAQLPNLPISSIAVFEPNLFCLLTLGLDHDKEMWAVALQFFTRMLEVAGRGEWDEWGDTFHRFWFGGRWSDLDPGVREKLVSTTVPQTVHEIEALVKTMEDGEDYARTLLNGLASKQVDKRVVLGSSKECGSAGPSMALANLLHREAGFQQVLRAPEGGHMGPLTHPQQVLPLLLNS